MKSTNSYRARSFAATILVASCGTVLAGRPLTVDDANTNDQGAGHVEMWAAREAGRADTLNVSPAYGLFDGLEVAAQFARNRTASATTSALQAKWRITASDENGCNMGTVVGAGRVSAVSGTTGYVNGLVTCNGKDWGSVHFNLGASKSRSISATRTWGVAVERELSGVTPSLEWFGSQGQKPTVQFGLRSEIVKNVQLDGTAARADGETAYSVGLKLQF
jgi:hypothetical protein